MNTPDTRRTWRTLERVLSAIAALGLLAWIIGLLGGNADWLGWIAMGLLIILGMREFMIGSENVAARLDLSFGKDGAKANLDSKASCEAAAGAQSAADAAQEVAEELKP